MICDTKRGPEHVAEYFQQLTITSPVNETELKIALKETLIAAKTDDHHEVVRAFQTVLETQLTDLIGPGVLDKEVPSENEIANLLQFFRIFGEDPACRTCLTPTIMTQFATAVFPNLTAVIGKTADGESLASSQKSSALLHKAVRISLNLVKSFLALPEASRDNLEDFGLKFISLLSEHPMAMLDIKCNEGLVICHLISAEVIDRMLEAVVSQGGITNMSKIETEVWKFMSTDYVNKIAACFGALGTRQAYQVEFMESVAKVVLLQSHSNSTKEAVNLGSSRVLEIWMDKIVLKLPEARLQELYDVFRLIEVFIFTYMAGHIDAVKNCCRNMLSNLSIVYSRLDSSGSLLRELLEKILAKPYHIKWVSLSAVCRNNPQSVILLDVWDDVANRLLCAERTFKNAASEVYISLMKYSPREQSWASVWINPLLQTQESQNNESNWSQKRTILAKTLGSPDKEVQQLILSTIITVMNASANLCTESWLLIVECLKIAVELGIEFKNIMLAGTDHANEKFRGVLPRDVFNSWTFHENPQIRLASLSLLVDAKKTSEVFSTEDFGALKQLFRYNLVSQNPAFRQQFFAYFKKLMRRLKDGRSFCNRMKRLEDVKNYDDFIGWMWTFFTRDGLFAGANFSRRCQSLTCLVELLNHFDVKNFINLLGENESLGFLHWLGDSYENNKVAAVQILSQLQIPKFQDPEFVNETLQTAMKLLVSVKPPESVTGRYLLLLLLKASPLLYPWNILRMLLVQLEQINYSLKKKGKSLLEISSTTPPYGLVRAIRLLFDSYKVEIIHDITTDTRNTTRPLKSGSYALKFDMLQEYATRVLSVCFELDEILFPVLGDAAPEGFLPDLNENENFTPESSKIVRSMNAQMLLVSSWRSMKEICILLTELCVNFPLEGELPSENKKAKVNYILKFQQVKSIGDHLLYLLMNLMHRGVFEQVFVGFKSLCTRLKKSKDPKLNNLSKEWLQDIMAKVADKCTTRRSAGLPFIFQAILSPEAGNEQVMTYWMKKLLETDSGLKELMPVRIHSMNVLRALFRDATFSHAIMEWVPEGIQLAFRGLRAKEWAEQNSGLMLYGSVIRRTFGPKLNLMSAPTFFRRFPQMYDILLEEIKATAALLSTEGTAVSKNNDFAYHLLLLFSCFATAPGKLEEGNFHLSAFIPHVRACGASRDIQVRTIAAKALIPFITSADERQRVLVSILDDLIFFSRKFRNNKIHGDLCQLIAIVNLIQSRGEKVCEASADRLQQIIDLPKNTRCPLIFEAFGELSIALQRFRQTNLVATCLSMQKVNAHSLQTTYPRAVRRNSVVGLPDADLAVAESQVIVCPESVKEVFQDGSPALVNGVLKVLQELGNKDFRTVTDQELLNRYSVEVFRFDGQTELEYKYLSYFGGPHMSFTKEMDAEVLKKVTKRMMPLCEGQYGTMECKGAALRALSKLLLQNEILNDVDLRDALVDLILDWTASTTDDELRHASAVALPKFPLQDGTLTPMQFCKLWTAAFTLAQDDEAYIRSEVYQKLSPTNQVPACSWKCLELMTAEFLKQIEHTNTLEGLWTLLGLLLRDDFEVVATVADDEEEDRLFDRSEMNMFAETVTATKIVVTYLRSNPQILVSLREALNLPASNQVLNFFTDISNLTLEIQVQESSTNVELLRQIIVKDVQEEERSAGASLDDLLKGHEKSAVQDFIRGQLRELLLP